MQFLQYTKNREKAAKALQNLKKWILAEGVICKDRFDEGWGLYGKPHSLYYAPSPKSVLYPIFSKEMIDADLDELIKRQKADGRWDTWYGLSEGMKLEWAGIQTLWTLKALKNYGRIKNKSVALFVLSFLRRQESSKRKMFRFLHSQE